MEHLREGFRSGHWRGILPGVRVLARELNVSKDTMEIALHRLEVEGSIKPGGPGRSREVVIPRDAKSNARVLRVGILLANPLEEYNPNAQQVMLGLSRGIEHAGHICFFARKSMRELGDKVSRIAKMVEAAKADAWVVHGAPRNVLDWFSACPTPVFLIGGVSDGLGLASSHTDLSDALFAAVSELTTLGHRLIVMISPETWRIPQPSKSAQAFMDAMKKCGHNPTSFNLPAFDDTPEGLERLLHSIFLITPPTALLFVEPESYIAALGFLGSRGLRIPQDISVLSMISSPIFRLMPKRPAHFKWPVEQHVRRVVRWVVAVANGAEDHDQIKFSATFNLGGTIGPAVRAGRTRSSGSHR
jgi:DNA-binding LacI/PurR family transcriptional regulator